MLRTAAVTVAAAAVAYVAWRRRRRPVRGRLWGSPVSTCSRRVVAALAEVRADYSFVPIDLAKGEQKSNEALLALQPFGKVPAWQDAAGFAIFESRAIMRHVAEGTALVPSAAAERAAMEQWVSIEYSYFYAPFLRIYRERVLAPMFARARGAAPPAVDEALCEAARRELEPTLDLMEGRLTQSAYLAGGAFTLADLTFLCYFAQFDAAGLRGALDTRPALAGWWGRCSDRPSWRYAMSGEVVRRALSA